MPPTGYGGRDGGAITFGFDLSGLVKDAHKVDAFFNRWEEHAEHTSGYYGTAARMMDALGRQQHVLKEIGRLNELSVRDQEKRLDLLSREVGIERNRYGGYGSVPSGAAGFSRTGIYPEDERGAGRVAGLTRFGYGLGGVGQAYQQMNWQGGTDSSVAGFAGSLANMVPIAGPLFKMAAELVAGEFRRDEDMARLRYRVGQVGGEGARQTYMEAALGGKGASSTHQRLIDLGIDAETAARLTIGASRAGISHRLGSAMNTLAGLESETGLGNEGVGVIAASRRAGAGERQSIDAIGTAIGVALATGLDHGRWGEVMANISRAALSVTNGMYSAKNVADTQAFVGSLGPAFQGTSGSADAMGGMLNSLSTGQGGGLSQMLSLQAGGLGRGGASFGTAWINSKLGITGGGINPKDLVQLYARLPDVRQAFLGGKPGRSAKKDLAISKLSMMTGQDPGLLLNMLDGYFYNATARANLGGAHTGLGGAMGWLLERFNPAFWTGDRMIGRQGAQGSYDRLNNDVGGTQQDFSPGPLDAIAGGNPWGGSFDMVGGGAAAGVVNDFSDPAIQGWNQKRGGSPDGRGGYSPGSRAHQAQDMYFPPGTPIAVTERGIVGGIGATNGPVSLYGYTIIFRGEASGLTYKYNHIEKPMVATGQTLNPGKQIGTTIHRKKFKEGGVDTHLDLGIMDHGEWVKPTAVLGQRGIEAMTMGTWHAGHGGGAPAQGNMASAIHVFVHDARTTIRTVGGNLKAAGQLLVGGGR